jgi:hypothetical protein
MLAGTPSTDDVPGAGNYEVRLRDIPVGARASRS